MAQTEQCQRKQLDGTQPGQEQESNVADGVEAPAELKDTEDNKFDTLAAKYFRLLHLSYTVKSRQKKGIWRCTASVNIDEELYSFSSCDVNKVQARNSAAAGVVR